MNPSRSIPFLTRRGALKAMGASALAMTAGFLSRGVAAGETPASSEPSPAAPPPPAPTAPTGPFTLPPLGYDYAALEPAIDALTMEIHHTRHHQAYINAANLAAREYPELQGKTAEEILRSFSRVPNPVRATVRNHVGGHANHALFWDILTPGGPKDPGGALASRINSAFGSQAEFLRSLHGAALGCFGSGWAWLTLYNGKLSVYSTANQDSPLMDGATPLLGIDVWEHAYYLNYQNRRSDYVNAVIGLINWDRVAARLNAALKQPLTS